MLQVSVVCILNFFVLTYNYLWIAATKRYRYSRYPMHKVIKYTINTKMVTQLITY